MGEEVIVKAHKNVAYTLSAEQWVMLVYVVVATALLAMALFAAARIARILYNHPIKQIEKVYFLTTEEKGTPFAFLNYIVWSRHLDIHSKTGRQIFRHELAHVQEKHTLDKVFLLLVLIPFWANPFFWLIRKELHAIHEFIADQKAMDAYNTEELAQMILNTAFPQQALLFTNPFFHSIIKRRIYMFNQLHTPKASYAGRILILPLFVLVVTAFTLKPKQTPLAKHQPPTAPAAVVADKKDASAAKSTQESIGTIEREIQAKNRDVVKDTMPKKMERGTDIVFSKAEVEPKFPGGAEDWRAFLQQHLNAVVPVDSGAAAGTYTVLVQFIVYTDGSISDLKALTNHGYGMEAEVLRVMKLSPNWEPAIQNRHKVKAYKKQPVTFVIAEEDVDTNPAKKDQKKN